MKTVADFKRKMVKGAAVHTLLYWNDNNGKPKLQRDFGTRKVTIVQSNSFALETTQPGKPEPVDSWCEWPKKTEFKPIDENKAEIYFQGGKLIYEFIR